MLFKTMSVCEFPGQRVYRRDRKGSGFNAEESSARAQSKDQEKVAKRQENSDIVLGRISGRKE